MGPSLVSILQVVGSRFSRSSGAHESVIDACELELKLPFPLEYREFLLWSDGGELALEGQAIDFWGVQRIQTRNAALSMSQYLPHVMLIGSNEGETALGFDLSGRVPVPVAVPFGDLSADAVARIEGTMGGLVVSVVDGAVDLEEICYPS